MTAGRGKSLALLVFRFALTGALLGLAFLLIDFTPRVIVHLRSGEKVEAVSVHQEGMHDAVRAILPDKSVRVFPLADVERFDVRPGLFEVLGSAKPWPALLVFPALVLVYLAQACRWKLLLHANGFEIPFGRALKVTWAGVFFNQILPGSVGGDVAKALIVARGEERKAGAFGTVLLDRLVGLGTVVLIAGLAVLPVLNRAELRPVVWLIAGLIGGGAIGAALYFNPWVRSLGPTRWIKERLPFRESIKEVDSVLKTMHHAPRTILGAVGLSALGQASTILGIYSLAYSLGAGEIPVGDFFLFEPIIFLVTAVPVSVGGWGVEQVAYVKLFGMAGMAATAAVALSVLYKLCLLVVSLPGGILFAAGATRRPAAAATAGDKGRS